MPRHIGMVFASALALGIGALGAASAADLPLKAAPLPVVVYNWTSCYGGVNGGWKGGRFGENVSSPATVATVPGVGAVTVGADFLNLGHLNADSGAVGGQIGCRWEGPTHWVFGVEGDFDWTNLNGTIRAATGGTGGTVFIPGDSYYNQARWESSVRGIIGRSFDKWLFYATGGLAIIDVRMQGNFIATVNPNINGLLIPFPASAGGETKALYGFTIGAGAAYAISKNWDIGAEYRYSQYSGDNFNLGQVAAFCFPGGACANATAIGHKDLTTNEVLFKLNYHFGPAAAVVAKY
jgi:outer membrane immunogenic protein